MERKKVVNLVEFQLEKQRNLQECIDYLQDRVDRGEISRLLCIFKEGEVSGGYVVGDDKREYKKSEILWDVHQWMKYFIY